MPVYIYTTLDDPFALTGTEAGDTNATGQVVGNYQNAGGNHGFLYNNGSYTISNVPPGNYTLTAWQETLGTQTQKVTVSAGAPAKADFTFKAK